MLSPCHSQSPPPSSDMAESHRDRIYVVWLTLPFRCYIIFIFIILLFVSHSLLPIFYYYDLSMWGLNNFFSLVSFFALRHNDIWVAKICVGQIIFVCLLTDKYFCVFFFSNSEQQIVSFSFGNMCCRLQFWLSFFRLFYRTQCNNVVESQAENRAQKRKKCWTHEIGNIWEENCSSAVVDLWVC